MALSDYHPRDPRGSPALCEQLVAGTNSGIMKFLSEGRGQLVFVATEIKIPRFTDRDFTMAKIIGEARAAELTPPS